MFEIDDMGDEVIDCKQCKGCREKTAREIIIREGAYYCTRLAKEPWLKNRAPSRHSKCYLHKLNEEILPSKRHIFFLDNYNPKPLEFLEETND